MIEKKSLAHTGIENDSDYQMFELSKVRVIGRTSFRWYLYMKVLHLVQGEAISVRVRQCSSYRGFEVSRVFVYESTTLGSRGSNISSS